jgi:hypothetical protein
MIPFLSVGIHLSQSPIFLIAAVVAVWFFTLWVYRHTVPPVASWKRTVLRVLRVLSLAVLLLLLWKPVLSFFVEESDVPILAVLIDDSASMGLQSEGATRSDAVQALLQEPVWKNLSDRFDIRYFAFADSVWSVPKDKLDQLAFNRTGTNLYNAWQGVETALRDGNYAAALILSDGDNNAGENPVRMAQYSMVPIFTVGMGDSTPARDAMIVQTITNQICYTGDEVPLNVLVRGVGIQGETSIIKLIGPDGENLGAQSVHWKSDFFEDNVRFTFIPKEAGTWKYEVFLEPLPDELTTNNNRKSFYIKVLESKVNVLILAGAPDFDLEFLVKSLQANPRISYTQRTQKAHGGYYEGAFPSADDLRRTNLIILHHYPSAETPMGDLIAISNAAKSSDLPVMFLMGSEVSLRKLDMISDIVPVRTVRYADQTVEVSCAGGASHVIFENDEGQVWIKWEGLPPVWMKPYIFAAKDGSQVIAIAYPPNGAEPVPAIVVRKAGMTKSMAVLPWGLWKWGFQRSQEQSSTLESFVDRSIRYLVTREEDKRLRITTSKPIYQGGETVRFSAQVYNEDYQPVDGADVEVRVSAGGETVRLGLDGEGNGRYSGDLSPWTEGEYSFQGTAKRGGLLGEDRGKFTVEAFNIEFLNTAMNPTLLRTVATQSGGAFTTSQDFASLATGLHFPRKQRTVSWEVPLWNRAWLLWVFIGLLAVEWLIRKRSGML